MIPEENTPENCIAQAYMDTVDSIDTDELALADAIIKRLNEHGFMIVGQSDLEHSAHACYHLARNERSDDWMRIAHRLNDVFNAGFINAGRKA